MQRNVFERHLCDGFRNSKVESLAATVQGKRLFAGATDGVLALYECKIENTHTGSKAYTCRPLETIRKVSKDKKPTQSLLMVESWRVIVGIMDGCIVAYDSQFYQQLGIITESKSHTLFSVNEKQYVLLAVSKKKLSQYVWQSPGFNLRKDFTLIDVPKTIIYLRSHVVIGYKKFYESMDLHTGITTRLLDFEREHKMLTVEFPGNIFRNESVLVTLGLQGVFLDIELILHGQSFAYGSATEERIEWSGPPQLVQILNPFIITALPDAIEVHSLANLSVLQKISFPSGSILSLAAIPEESVPTATSLGQHAFICNGDQLSVLKMTPLVCQVEALVNAGCHEEAINMYQVCENKALVNGIDITYLYEANAFAMLNKGDFEKAVNNFIAAKTDFLLVAANFPDFIPSSLQTALSISSSTGKKYSGVVLQRAALAVATLCESHRVNIMRRAERAEKVRETGFMASSSASASFNKANSLNPFGKASFSESNTAAAASDEYDEDYIANPEEEIARAMLVDTMLLHALMFCVPPKKSSIVELLRSPNRCQIESCSVLLASNGDAYIEALLWLYRSQNQHTRVLQALTEDRCVRIGGWSRDQFYRWTAEYLQWLWYHDEDMTLPKQALTALKPVIEYDAELGLSVLVCRPFNKSSFGGKGVTITEVLTFLRGTMPKINYSRGPLNWGYTTITGAKLGKERGTAWQNEKIVAAVLADTHLVNGHALGVAFLECLVNSGEAPANMHDEFAQLLVEGLPLDDELGVDHTRNDLEVQQADSEQLKLYKIYRRKLQNFLSVSLEYHPQRVLKFLPRPYLHENALVLSRLGRHREVLRIYLHQLNQQDLAEAYCGRIYALMTGSNAGAAAAAARPPLMSRSSFSSNNSQQTAATPLPTNLNSPGEIYLLFFQLILDEEEDQPAALQGDARFTFVMNLAEKYYDRFDVNAFLELLPRNTPVAILLKYFQIVYEFQSSRKRNLQIVHQLLRTREVYLRTAGAQENAASTKR